MAEKKKQKPAAFAQEKKPLPEKFQKKANEGKGKKSAAYQPRDADTTSGHDVQRSKKYKRSIRKQMLLDRMSKSPREQKPERSLKAILCSRTALLRRKPERSRVEKLPAMTTATGTPIIRHRKRAGIKGGR